MTINLILGRNKVLFYFYFFLKLLKKKLPSILNAICTRYLDVDYYSDSLVIERSNDDEIENLYRYFEIRKAEQKRTNKWGTEAMLQICVALINLKSRYGTEITE